MLTLIEFRLKLATAGRLLSSLSPSHPFKVSTRCSNGIPFLLLTQLDGNINVDVQQSHP